jgi:2-succinyl-6-hydroxy-2,4-cyclohexadiene-1-carboxylate synthase
VRERYPILLHGFTGSSLSWGDAVLDGLASAAGAPVLVDLPGHGRYAQGSDERVVTLAAALAAIDDAGEWPDDIVGYSMGGRIALHFAAAHPGRVRRLVLESASPGLADPKERAERRLQDESLADRIEREGVPSFVDYWEARPLFESRLQLPDDVRSRQRAERLRNTEGGLASSLRGLGTGALPSLWERLPAIDVPTLIVAGELDSKFVDIGRRMAQHLPDARLTIVSGAGHTVHLEKPDEWLEVVGSFLLRG